MNDTTDLRVRLRSFALEDALAVYRYASDPEVSRYLDWPPHQKLADSERFIRSSLAKRREEAVVFAVEEIASGRILGAVDLRIVDPLRRFGEIGYSLAREHWGRGFNLEAGRLLLDYAFGDLRLLRVQASCDVANRRSYRTMEKLGMQRERLLPRARVRDGRRVDCYLYGILWREWAALCARWQADGNGAADPPPAAAAS